jgi:hypothetical protein
LQAARTKHRPKLAKELPSLPRIQNEFKNISSPSKNKKYAIAQPNTTAKLIIDKGLQTRWTEGQLITAVAVAQPHYIEFQAAFH